jgi:hypothetical protein
MFIVRSDKGFPQAFGLSDVEFWQILKEWAGFVVPAGLLSIVILVAKPN